MQWAEVFFHNFLLVNIKNRILHVLRGPEGALNGGLEMTPVNACPSLHSVLTGGLIFSSQISAGLWQRACNLHVRQTTNGLVHVKIGGDAWQFLHNAVSSWLDPDLLACLLSQSEGRSKINHSALLCYISDINMLLFPFLPLTPVFQFRAVWVEVSFFPVSFSSADLRDLFQLWRL